MRAPAALAALLFAARLAAAVDPRELESPVAADLLADVAAAAPGKPFLVAVRLTHATGWHTYWRNSGDSGAPTTIAWELPEGARAGPILWPVPERIEGPEGVVFAYRHEAALLTEITPPPAWPAGSSLVIRAKVKWLVCFDACRPGGTNLSLTLPVRDATFPSPHAPFFVRARAALPSPTWEGAIAASVTPADFVLHVNWPDRRPRRITDAQFFPYEGELIRHDAPQQRFGGDEHLTLAMRRFAAGAKPPARAQGVLVLDYAEDGAPRHRALEVETPVVVTYD